MLQHSPTAKAYQIFGLKVLTALKIDLKMTNLMQIRHWLHYHLPPAEPLRLKSMLLTDYIKMK